MRLGKRIEIGALAAGLALGCGIWAFAQDKPPADRPTPTGEARGRGSEAGQGRFDPREMLERMERHWNETLNLSEDQKAKVKSIIAKAKTDIDAALKAGESEEPRERFGRVREVMRPVREQMTELLDQTQRDKLRESGREFAGPRPGGPGGPDGPGGPRGPGGPEGRRPGGFGDQGFGGPRGPGRPGGPGGPGGPDGPPMGHDPMQRMHHLRARLDKLELNAEQQKKVDALISETEKKLSDLQTETEKAQAETRAKFRTAMQASREQLESVLTEQQRQKLREMGPGPRPDGAGRGDGGPGRRGPRPDGAGPQSGGDGPPPPTKQPGA